MDYIHRYGVNIDVLYTGFVLYSAITHCRTLLIDYHCTVEFHLSNSTVYIHLERYAFSSKCIDKVQQLNGYHVNEHGMGLFACLKALEMQNIKILF